MRRSSPDGHRLVNLRFSIADIRREADGRTYHALVRFRAVTEPATVRSSRMAAQKGKDLLIKIDDGTSFVTVAGLRSRRHRVQRRDWSTSRMRNRSDRWRELLAGAGVRRASISGRGLFKDARVRCAGAAGILRRRGEATAR